MWIWSGEQRTDTGAAIFSSWSLVPRARQRTVSWKIASRARTARGRHTIACLAIGGWCGPNESGEKTWHARTRGTRKRGDGMRCSRCTKESLLHPSYRSAFGASCQPARPSKGADAFMTKVAFSKTLLKVTALWHSRWGINGEQIKPE